jgi:hypothetical protein
MKRVLTEAIIGALISIRVFIAVHFKVNSKLRNKLLGIKGNDLKHISTVNLNGRYQVRWLWTPMKNVFPVQYCWNYYLNFYTMEDAQAFLDSYVKLNWPEDKNEIVS